MPIPVMSPARTPRPSVPPTRKSSLPSASQQTASPDRPNASPSSSNPLSPSRIPSFPPSPRLSNASPETDRTSVTSSSPARPLSTSSQIPSLSPSRIPSSSSIRSSENGVPSRPSSASSDSARMPPPPVPAAGRRVSGRERSTTIPSPASKASSEKKSALGRAGSVIRRSVGVVKREDKEEKGKAKPAVKAAESKTLTEKKSTGSTRSLRSQSSATSGTKASVAKGKDEKPNVGLGRTMSLRSRPSVEERKSSLRSNTTTEKASALARPRSMVGPSELAAARVPSTARKPPTAPSWKQEATASATARKSAAAPTDALRSHRRATSTASTLSTASTASKTSVATTVSATTKPKRPAFTTFNQPLDPPPQPAAPPSPRSRAKTLPPPPLDQATIHKQTQLLQLMVLYTSAGETYDQLCDSANQKLQNRFEAISSKHAEERAKLQELQKSQDFAGLAAVVETPATGLGENRRETLRSPEEKIQAFSEALKRLESLQGNEYRRVEKKFGEWIAGYAPPSPSPYGTQRDYINRRGRWIDGLGEEWRRSALGVVRRIETSIRGVEAICQCAFQGGEDGGVVGMVAEGWAEVARGMLEECEVMRKMERDIVTRERGMLKGVVEGVVRSSPSPVAVGGGIDGGGGGIWGRY